MTHPSVRDLAEAKAYFLDQREELKGLDSLIARRQFDLLDVAIQECDDLVRDRRCAEEVHQQSHARSGGRG
jgi:hypothetical protein